MFDVRKRGLHSPSPDVPSSFDGCQCDGSETFCQKQHLALRHSPQALYLQLWTCFCIYHTVNMSLSSISLLDCCALGWQFPKATLKLSMNCGRCIASFWESNFQEGSSLFVDHVARHRSSGLMSLHKVNRKIYSEPQECCQNFRIAFTWCYFLIENTFSLLSPINPQVVCCCIVCTESVELLCLISLTNLSNTHISVTCGSKCYLLRNACLVVIGKSMGNILLFY